MADPLLSLGKTPEGDARRDAIHIAVIPLTTIGVCKPGDHVGVRGNLVSPKYTPHVGIIDPFLPKEHLAKPEGQRVWVFLYPNSVAGMRHAWEHPAFMPEEEPPAERKVVPLTSKARAAEIMTEVANAMGLSFGKLLEMATQCADGLVDYHTQYWSEDWRDGFDAAKFWPAFETYTGKKRPASEFIFNCSC